MTSEEAKATISALATAYRIRTVPHARERMLQRNIRWNDIRAALIAASTCVASTDVNRWIVTGFDLGGDELKVVCAIEGDVVVITVF